MHTCPHTHWQLSYVTCTSIVPLCARNPTAFRCLLLGDIHSPILGYLVPSCQVRLHIFWWSQNGTWSCDSSRAATMDTWTLTHSPLHMKQSSLPRNRSGDQREDRVVSHQIGAGHDPMNTLTIFCSHLSGPLYHLLNLFSYAFSALDHTDPQVSFLWFFRCAFP